MKGSKKTVQFAAVENESRPEQALKYLKCFLADEDLLHEVLADKQTADLLREISVYLHGSSVSTSPVLSLAV